MRATSATGSWSVRTPSCRTPCADPPRPCGREDRNTWTVTVSNCNLAVAPPPDGCRRNGGKILKTSPGRSPRKTRKRSRIEFLLLFLCYSVFLYAARSSASVSRSLSPGTRRTVSTAGVLSPFVRLLHPAAARSPPVSTPSIAHLSWFSLHSSSTVASSARAIRIARYTLGTLSPRSITPSVLWLHPTFCASQR